MKQYKKTYEDISSNKYVDYLKEVEPVKGTYLDMVKSFRAFYHSAHLVLFDMLVKQLWLETQFTFRGKRRLHYMGNGIVFERAYSFFMTQEVGINQKILSMLFIHAPIATYIPDLFPEFLKHDPFEEPEYFKFPYQYVTLDHLLFCYQCEDRLEMLKYADEQKMTIKQFMNWGANHSLSQNEEGEKDLYMMSCFKTKLPYIHRLSVIKNGKGKQGKKGIFTKLYD